MSFELFEELYGAIAAATLPHFRTRLTVDNKLADRHGRQFDPVTIADREAETAIRHVLRTHFPNDGILGEEFGLDLGAAPNRWIIDPIDGTRAFISGLPVWGSLVGRYVDGRAQLGMMAQPFTGELYCADDTGAFLLRPGSGDAPIRLSTSDCTVLASAIGFTTSPRLYRNEDRERFETLEDRMRLMRFGCDCYAFALLAAGHCDLVVEPGLQSYDIAGLIALVEQAGGVITTFDGDRPEDGGNIIAAATPELHAAARAVLSVG